MWGGRFPPRARCWVLLNCLFSGFPLGGLGLALCPVMLLESSLGGAKGCHPLLLFGVKFANSGWDGFRCLLQGTPCPTWRGREVLVCAHCPPKT